MLVTDLQSPVPGSPLLDLDLRDGTRAAVAQRDAAQIVAIEGWQFELPRLLRLPIVRLVDKRTAVVADRLSDGTPNAWLLRSGVGVVAHFFAGNGITEAVSVSGVLVVGYDDEAIYGRLPHGSEGIAVFSLEGAFRWGYNSSFGGRSESSINDCYCACAAPDGRVWFQTYSDRGLIVLDIHSKTQQWIIPPRDLRMSSALSSDGVHHWFFGPGENDRTIFKWSPPDPEPTRIGSYDGKLRGLTGGRFISVTPTGARLVEVAA
jgi:hypothetical protein